MEGNRCLHIFFPKIERSKNTYFMVVGIEALLENIIATGNLITLIRSYKLGTI